jgi:hypothetical protein
MLKEWVHMIPHLSEEGDSWMYSALQIHYWVAKELYIVAY